MQNNRQSAARNRTSERTAIVLALVVALFMHGFFLLLPIAGKSPPVNVAADRIELQLSTFIPQTPDILQPLLVRICPFLLLGDHSDVYDDAALVINPDPISLFDPWRHVRDVFRCGRENNTTSKN